jgi:hypothetical protein
MSRPKANYEMSKLQDTAKRMSISTILNSPDQSANSRVYLQNTEQIMDSTVEPQRRAVRLRSPVASSDAPAAKRVKLSELLEDNPKLPKEMSDPLGRI